MKFSVPISSFKIRRIVFKVTFYELIAGQSEEYLLLHFISFILSLYISLYFNFQKRLVAGKHINISAYKICLWYFISRELIEFAESVLIISISLQSRFMGTLLVLS